MSTDSFVKITPVNGFDSNNPDNAMQNNYAWSMTEMGDYLYVGTARDIPYMALKFGAFGTIKPPKEITPKVDDFKGEIWRYKKGGGGWEQVFKAGSIPETETISGFRFMVTYTTPSNEKVPNETAVYAWGFTLNSQLIIVKSTDGKNWSKIIPNISASSSRAVVVHDGKLYMSVVNELAPSPVSRIYVTTDPERNGWTPVTGTDENKNPRGDAWNILFFNNHMYAGTGHVGGLEVWRSEASEPESDKWKLIVDKGAGDALNEVTFSMGVFKDHLYVGSGIQAGFMSIDPSKKFVAPKGFDIIKIDKNDNWKIVVGGKPREATEPTKGTRNQALYPSGFGNPANGYCWQIQEYNGELYIGSWEWLDLVRPIYNSARESGGTLPPEIDNPLLKLLLDYPELVNGAMDFLKGITGFDLWKSRDGNIFTPVSLNGFNNTTNYGARMLYPASDGNLYLGTANPFHGCEVWVKRKNAGGGNSYIYEWLSNLLRWFIPQIISSNIPQKLTSEFLNMLNKPKQAQPFYFNIPNSLNIPSFKLPDFNQLVKSSFYNTIFPNNK